MMSRVILEYERCMECGEELNMPYCSKIGDGYLCPLCHKELLRQIDRINMCFDVRLNLSGVVDELECDPPEPQPYVDPTYERG